MSIQVNAFEAAYAAGLFDGEGCVMIEARPEKRKGYPEGHHTFRARLTVTQVDLRPLFWLQERFGGRVSRKTERRLGKSPVHSWEVSNLFLDRFVSIIRPYTIVKSDRLDVLVAFRKFCSQGNPRSLGLTPEQVQVRSEFHQQMRILNRRGVR